MRTFYIILLGLSGGYLLLQLAVHLLFGRPLFPNAGELFEHTKSRAEWQTVFPKNLLRLIVFVFVTSFIGLLLDCAGAVSWLGLPLAAAGGLAFNFLLSTVFSPMYLKLHKQGEPSEKELENMDGVVTEEISPDMYGGELPEGTEVIVIYSEDSACFVESKERFFDVLFEEGAAPETPAREADDDSWRA